PADAREIAAGSRRIVADQFVRARKADPGLDLYRAFLVSPLRPGRAQPAKVHEWIADRRKLPVDHGGELGTVVAVHDVGEMIISMHDAGPKTRRPVCLQPVADPAYVSKCLRTGPILETRVAFQLRSPARYLALQKALRLAEIPEAQGLEIQGAQLGNGFDKRQAHSVLHLRRTRMKGRQS